MPEPTQLAAHADAALFADVLSCQLQLPAEFSAATTPPGPAQAESLLHALALIEDTVVDDAPDERGESSPLIQRINAKLDVLLLLVGQLLQRGGTSLPQQQLRWSVRGVRLDHPHAAHFPIGHIGVLRLQPSPWLPEPLQLPARVLASEADGPVWLAFSDLPPTLIDALERHLFRQHRRAIAQARCGNAAALSKE